MLLLIIGLCILGWWAQRDAFKTGIEVGRVIEQRKQMDERIKEMQSKPKLYVVK